MSRRSRMSGHGRLMAIAALVFIAITTQRHRLTAPPTDDSPCTSLSRRFSQEARIVSGNYALNNKDWLCAAAFLTHAADNEPGLPGLQRKAMIAALNSGDERQALDRALLQLGDPNTRGSAAVLLAAKIANQAENDEALATMWALLSDIPGQAIYDELLSSPNLGETGDGSPRHLKVKKELSGMLYRRGNFLRSGDRPDDLSDGLFFIRCALIADPTNQIAARIAAEIGGEGFSRPVLPKPALSS